jgi:hypothetical protein
VGRGGVSADSLGKRAGGTSVTVTPVVYMQTSDPDKVIRIPTGEAIGRITVEDNALSDVEFCVRIPLSRCGLAEVDELVYNTDVVPRWYAPYAIRYEPIAETR